MARRPTQLGHAGAPLRLVPLAADPGVRSVTVEESDDERTTVEEPPKDPAAAPASTSGATGRDPSTETANTGRPVDAQWDDGTGVEESTIAGTPPGEGSTGIETPEEMTVEEGRPTIAKLVVLAGNDTGREFTLTPGGKPLSVGRAIDNDIVLTDIAVSRKHLDLLWEGGGWTLRDRGSGNGTLLNDEIEEGQRRLQAGDRIEIGHTIFRFDQAGTANALPAVAWNPQSDDEPSTVAGRAPPKATLKGPAPAVDVPAPATSNERRKPVTLPPPRPRTASAPASTSGAVSARLALPATPPTARFATVEASGAPVSEPRVLAPLSIVTAVDRADRSMTATAHVEPLSYSGSMPPLPSYPFPTVRAAPKRRIAIAASVAVSVTLIGVVAMLTTGADSREPSASTDARSAAATKAPSTGSADPTRVAAVRPDAGVAVEPETPTSPAAVDAGPAKTAVEPAKTAVEPAKTAVEPAKTAVEPAKTAVEPPPTKAPTKVEPSKVAKAPAKPPTKSTAKATKTVAKTTVKTPKTDPKKATSATAAKKKAAALYASKDFKGAAALCRTAAETAPDTEAAELRKLAASYDKLGESLASGNAAASSKPTDALAAYRRALAADKLLGGTHAAMIREKLGHVAPKAAAGFLSKGNYEAARQAADTAVNFGEGASPTVTQVRKELEKKAGELYNAGVKALSSKPEEGKAQLRRVLKIVPLDSPWYTKAYKQLNARPQKRDDDE